MKSLLISSENTFLAPGKQSGRAPARILFATALSLFSVCLCAQVSPADLQANREEIRRRQQEEEAERRQRLEQPRVDLETPPDAALDGKTIPEDPNGFLIRQVVVDTPQYFPWLCVLAHKYEGKKIGGAGLEFALRQLNNACIERGYVTMRVLLPEQDLTSGTLRFVVVPGKIGKIKTTPDSSWWGGTPWTAFPTSSGKNLNIRALEQGLEQMKRVPSQDVTMDLQPGENPGETDVVITRKNEFPIRFNFGVDNSGDKTTGKWQGSATVFWDNPFFLNDLFSATYNGSVDNAAGQGTHGDNFSYSVPFGWFTLFASYNAYDFKQTVQGFYNTFESTGTSRSGEARLQYLVYRDQNTKASVQARLTHRTSRNFIDGTEIDVQRRDTTVIEFAALAQRNFGATLVDGSVACRNGVNWFDTTDDFRPHTKYDPTNFYTAITGDLTVRTPFALDELQFVAQTNLHGQYTPDTLFGAEFFSIGNRYTVRGFDGAQTLGAENGFTWRNDISMALWSTGQWIYIAADFGYVNGPSARFLPGNALCGGAIGLRGGYGAFYYDVSVGTPFIKPDGFHAEHTTYTVQAGMQF